MKTYLNPKEVAIMEKCAISKRDRLLIRLLFRLGCRVSELLALKRGEVNYQDKTITIIQLKKRIKTSCPKCKSILAVKHRYCPECGMEILKAAKDKKNNKRIRILPIDRKTLSLLEAYLNVIDREISNSKLIFNINRHRAWQIVRNCARLVGLSSLVNPETGKLRGVSPHRLRDAFSVNAMKHDNSGDGLRLLQEHLGHTSFNTTAKYRKIAGDEHRDWYDHLWDSSGESKV
jgi:integrase/recombinase XerD